MRIPLLLTVLLFCCPVTHAQSKDEADSPGKTLPRRPPNTLSEMEKERGFVLLFDGETFEGWHGYQSEKPHDGWTVNNGMISLVEGKKGDLVSDKQYSSFDLRLQYRISENGNSGVFYHVDESLPRSPHSGPEVQIVDNNGEKWKEGDARHKDGANYALHAPAEDVSKPAGKWNALRVVVDGNHVRHFLNGTKIVDFEMHTDEWKEMVAATKFSKWPAYGMAGKGHIVLQDHGNPVSFRNIRILELKE